MFHWKTYYLMAMFNSDVKKYWRGSASISEITFGQLWKDPPFSMGKSTMSMAMFKSYFDITRG